MPRGKISKRQQEIYDYIKSYTEEHAYPPSVREIGTAVGLASPSTVHMHLKQLEEQGLIRRDSKKPRTIEVVQKEEPQPQRLTEVTHYLNHNLISLPVVGRVAAGTPILAEQNVQDVYSFPQGLLGTTDETFMLKVSGESMINAGIYDGDYVMVKHQDSANDGEIVVALVDEEGATVKRIYHEKDCIRLQPENDHMKPFYEKNVTVLGKVIGIYRQM